MARIAHFIDSPVFGGAEAVLLAICSDVRTQGFEPLVFVFDNPQLESRLAALNIAYERAPAYREFKSIRTLHLFAAAFAKTLHEHDVALVHSHLFGGVVGGSFSAQLARRPSVGTIHDSYTIEERPARIRLLQAAAFAGTRLVTVSQRLETIVRAHGWFLKSHVQTIYNGVDRLEISSTVRAEMRRTIGIPDDGAMVVSVGRLVDLKRFDLLIRAFALIPQSLKATLVIIGDGPNAAALAELIRELKAEAFVKLMGYRDDVQPYLAAADLFTLVSSTEGLSCSVLEALSAGVPCIVTDVGANAELVDHNRSGIVLRDDNESSIAAAIEELLKNPSARKDFSAQARNTAAARFSRKIMAENYASLYRSLLRKSNGLKKKRQT